MSPPPPIRRLLLPLAAVALLVVPAVAAAQNSFQQGFQDFKGDQQLNACSYSPDQLRDALGGVPPDVETYAPNFGDAVNSALAQHAAGGCAGGGGGQPGVPASAPTRVGGEKGGEGNDGSTRDRGAPGPPRPRVDRVVAQSAAPRLIPRSDDRNVPAALVALGGVFALTLLGAAALTLSRYFDWDIQRVYGPPLQGARTAGATLVDLAVGLWVGLWDRIRRGR